MPVMRIDEAEASLRDHLAKVGLRLDGDDAAPVLEAMMDWYAAERAVDAAPLDEDGDMLLFQWGTHDWGAGRVFEYDLTRQLVRADELEDEGIIQLSLTYRYPMTDATAALGSGHSWFGSPGDLAVLRREMEAHPASSAIRSVTPQEISMTCEVAG
jgi:hypothetical protein